MERYYKRKSTVAFDADKDEDGSKKDKVEIDLLDFDLPTDPGLRPQIMDYGHDIRDQVRRAYLQKGPCQPKGHNFPFTKKGQASRRFHPSWFDEYATWLEYSIAKDAAFCLCCYLFKPHGEQGGGDSFMNEGFSNWKKKERLKSHVGIHNSAHNIAWRKCQALMNQKQHIQTFFDRHSDQEKHEYRIRLGASIDCIRFLLHQGIALRGDDESEGSSNQGNFLELLQFLADHNEEIKAVTLSNAPGNNKLTSSGIQRDIVSVAATETTNAIFREMGYALFSILVDESRDISVKEQMAVVLRYVNKSGLVVERFIAIEHVTSTTALSLKESIDKLFSRHGLSISRLRGQGYDGASNMQGEFNGLKTLIMNENECAYYVHCFAHQLQLALIGVAKNHKRISSLFSTVNHVVNVVGASAKRRDLLRAKHAIKVIEALNVGDLSSGQGLNQETSLKRSGDTRWGSHYGTLINIIILFPSVIDVLEIIGDDGKYEQAGEANNLLDLMQSFNFVFGLHLMKEVLGITNELSQALQRKDQDIVNAMKLVGFCKQRLQMMRDSGWGSLLVTVSSFCVSQSIDVPNMDDMFVPRGRSRRNADQITNFHYYCVEMFYTVLDMQLQELNSRFNETNTELLLCLACLSPNNSFSAFDAQKLIHLAQFYPNDFSAVDYVALDIQLGTYIIDMRSSIEFSELVGISGLAKQMVDTKRDKVYPLVYKLVTLALILPVATATVERVFSAMNIIKNRLRNRMGDQLMNDSLVVYIEKDIFDSVDNETIMEHFQKMKPRRGQL